MIARNIHALEDEICIRNHSTYQHRDSCIGVRSELILAKCISTMPKYHFCIGSLGQHMNHLVAPDPVVVISGQPTLRVTIIIVLMYMVHVGCEDPGATVVEVHLHDTQSWSMSRRMPHVQAWCYLKEVSIEGLPIQVKRQVMWKINAYYRLMSALNLRWKEACDPYRDLILSLRCRTRA